MARKSRKHQEAAPTVQRLRTAIYARLSGRDSEQETMEAQIAYIKDYLGNKPVFEVIRVYSDNGYSGTSFNRPAFQEMMEDVRNGSINCIVVKDLSRFAREHIGAEDYLNNIFPFLGVRFIAINDGYDNAYIEPQEYFMTSFKNFAHAYFAQETSRKISMSYHVLQEQGKVIGSHPSFGYKFDPSRKHVLVVYEAEAAVVREIYERAASGESYRTICNALNAKNAPGSPWYNARIGAILHKELYAGTLVQRKTQQALYRNEAWHKVPEQERVRKENAVPAIVTQDLRQQALERLEAKKQAAHARTSKVPFYRLVYCALCGRCITSAYNKRLHYNIYQCKSCSGVYLSEKKMMPLLCNVLHIAPEQITQETMQKMLSRILINDQKQITCIGKDGERL